VDDRITESEKEQANNTSKSVEEATLAFRVKNKEVKSSCRVDKEQPSLKRQKILQQEETRRLYTS